MTDLKSPTTCTLGELIDVGLALIDREPRGILRSRLRRAWREMLAFEFVSGYELDRSIIVTYQQRSIMADRWTLNRQRVEAQFWAEIKANKSDNEANSG